MNKKDFDKVIRSNLVLKTGEDSFGYVTADNRTYEDYYCNKSFCYFIRDMRVNHNRYYVQYNSGSGGEFRQKKGRYGYVPPKMASVASSSRFCYLALRDGAEALGSKNAVEFEHECRIKGVESVTAPQLDGYIHGDEIYIEVKCHEIFDTHKAELKAKYHNIVYGEGNDFGFEVKEKCQGESFIIPLEEFDIKDGKSMVDIKQLLCHLMGVASVKKSEKATLLYLFFKPKTDDDEINRQIDEIFDNLTEDIKAVFKSKPVQNFAKKNGINLKAVMEYSERMTKLTKDNMRVLLEIDV